MSNLSTPEAAEKMDKVHVLVEHMSQGLVLALNELDLSPTTIVLTVTIEHDGQPLTCVSPSHPIGEHGHRRLLDTYQSIFSTWEEMYRKGADDCAYDPDRSFTQELQMVVDKMREAGVAIGPLK